MDRLLPRRLACRQHKSIYYEIRDFVFTLDAFFLLIVEKWENNNRKYWNDDAIVIEFCCTNLLSSHQIRIEKIKIATTPTMATDIDKNRQKEQSRKMI